MSTVELKEALIKKLESADDSLLKEILALIEFETTDEIQETSLAEKESIERGLKQIDNGETFTNQEVETEIDEWLSK